MIKTSYTYDLFVLLQKYKRNLTSSDDEPLPAQGFITSKLFSWFLIIFIGSSLLGYLFFLYIQLVLATNSSLF